MIKVKIKNKGITIKGHANFDNYGKDIVCAAVSSIVTTSINDMYVVNKDAILYSDDGNTLSLIILKENELIDKLFNNLKQLLINLSEDYPKNIKVESED